MLAFLSGLLLVQTGLMGGENKKKLVSHMGELFNHLNLSHMVL